MSLREEPGKGVIRRGNLSTSLYSLERERIIMRTHRVGAMPHQPKAGGGVGGVSGLVNRPRVHSGMSLEVSGRSQASVVAPPRDVLRFVVL